jgi:subtilisin family serine protease
VKAGRILTVLLAISLRAFAAAPGEKLWAPGDAPGTVLVSYRQGAGQELFRQEARRLGLSEKSSKAAIQEALHASVGGRVDLDVPRLGLQRVRLAMPDKAHVDAAILSYRSSALVHAAEPDHPIKAASISLNDTLYTGGQQRCLTATTWPQAVAAYNAGSISLVGTIIVAIVDTGVDPHADLATQLLAGTSFVSAEPSTDDLNGHGTFCAGLVAATTGNATGMAGAFFDPAKVRILPVKVLDSGGSGATSDLAAGVAWAVDHGARVINLSIQSSQGSDAMENAVNDARSAGVLVVAAAGNDSGQTSYPAYYSQVLSVASLDHNDNLAFYSNRGKIELSAPGGDFAVSGCLCQTAPVSGCPFEIWSLTAVTAAACPSPSYEAGAGTSFAAPLVCAAAALLFSQDPTRRVEDVERILLQTASPTTLGAGYNSQTGWGKLNFYGALTYQGAAQSGVPLKVYNWPNPFNPDKEGLTTLTFFLPSATATTLRLLDAGGDLVKRWDLDATQAAPGMNLVVWDGRNGLGLPVANGAYTLVLQCGSARATATVAVLR